MTCILVFTVLQTVCGKHRLDTGFAPIAIGFAVFLGHLVLIPLDGCSINPARALGPAIVANVWPGTFWIYVVSRRPDLACLASPWGLRVVLFGYKMDLKTYVMLCGRLPHGPARPCL